MVAHLHHGTLPNLAWMVSINSVSLTLAHPGPPGLATSYSSGSCSPCHAACLQLFCFSTPQLHTAWQEGCLSNRLNGFAFNLLSQQQNFPFPPAAAKTLYSFLALSQDWALPLSWGAGHVSHHL